MMINKCEAVGLFLERRAGQGGDPILVSQRCLHTTTHV